MDEFSVVVWVILGAALAALLLYVIIRLAVTHAIRATRVQVSRPAVGEPRHLDSEGF